MASLNTSQNGPSITKSYQGVVNAPPPTGPAAASPTYGQWAVFSVSAPLANAFTDAGNKESVLKLQSTGEGELVDLIDEFSDGRIQFAYVKVKDSNTGLPKNALVAWCGEGVPERTKGYFTSHLTAVAKLLHGYHVQITARSDRDLTPEGIIQKVADASGSKYSSSTTAPPPIAASTKPSIASKPAFTPTQTSSAPLRQARKTDTNVDADGWGSDAPPVTRTQLEKVGTAYKPTKVNMRELSSQPTSTTNDTADQDDRPGVVRGAYQPVGKVDIAEIRRRAKESGQLKDDRPETVKGAYEPVGKVDVAAIRARAQGSEKTPVPVSEPEHTPDESSIPTLAQRSAAFSQTPERLTSLPKPKVANRFGGSSSFTGTRAPLPGNAATVSGGVIGSAGRSLAESAGKSPAQVWAEKKARERGTSGSGSSLPDSGYSGASPMVAQTSGNTGYKSEYGGKKWTPVSTNKTGTSAVSEQRTGEVEPPRDEEDRPSGGIGSIRDRFSGAAPMGAPASSGYDRAPPSIPEPETSTRSNRGIPVPGMTRPGAHEESEEEEETAQALPPPPAQPRSPTPPTPEREESPIRVAHPISAAAPVKDVHEELHSPPPALPRSAISQAISRQKAEDDDDDDDEPEVGPDPARHAAQQAAAATMGASAVSRAPAPVQAPVVASSGKRMQAEHDYDKADADEVSLQAGEIVTDIEEVDENWWVVTNASGERGLVPSSYLGPLEDEPAPAPTTTRSMAAAQVPATATATSKTTREPEAEAEAESESEPAGNGATATALYDYEAGEDNEISFPDGATIINIVSPTRTV